MMCTYGFTNENEIKVLEFLKNSKGIHSRKIIIEEIDLENLPCYAILAIARDLEKRGFTSNSNGVLDITEQGKEYLIKLLNSN